MSFVFKKLLRTCEDGNVVKVRDILDGLVTAMLREEDASGDKCLHAAARSGQVALVSMLLDLGAAVNVLRFNGVTPLFEACYKGHDSVVKALLKAGACFNSATFAEPKPSRVGLPCDLWHNHAETMIQLACHVSKTCNSYSRWSK
eukprot:m.173187 g.173187  ORF g.173187 m.173187 type:complete len:145 (+) comp16731_c0_seq3:118-552(+)